MRPRLTDATLDPEGPSPVRLFQGYDTVTGFSAAAAVHGDQEPSEGVITSFYKLTSDTSSLYKALDISESASIDFIGLGGASEKAQFIQKLALTTYSLNIVIRVIHAHKATAIAPSKLSVAGPKDIDAFVRIYGDSYVSSITKGSEFIAVYTFYAESKSEQRSVQAQLSAKGITEVGNLDGSLQVKIDSASASSNVRLTFSQQVFGIKNVELPDRKNLVGFAQKFSALETDEPKVISFETVPYDRLIGKAFDPVVKNKSYLLGSTGIPGLLDNYRRISQAKNQINWLNSVYAFYGGFSDPAVQNAQPTVIKDLQAIEYQIQEYEKSPSKPLPPIDLPSKKLGTPALAITRGLTTPELGTTHSVEFNDIPDDAAYFGKKTRILSLRSTDGDSLTALTVRYEIGTGEINTVQHGGPSGIPESELKLQPGEFIRRISGTYGARVNRLKFDTTFGNTTRPVGGNAGANSFDWTVPANSFVAGFSGFSNQLLDSLFIIYFTFKPAQWETA